MASWLRRKLRSLCRCCRRDDGRTEAGEKARPRQKKTKPMSTDKFIESCLRAHNDYRKRHGVPPLTHAKPISAISQKWAEHLAKKNLFEHSKNRNYKGEPLGENIAMKWSSGGEDYPGEEPTAQWYNEISMYDFNRHTGSGTGHFTQVVWKGSKELGVGRAQGKDGKWIVVCNYSPAGNFIGRDAENVFPAGGGKTAAPSAHARPGSDDKKKPSSSSVVAHKPSSRAVVVPSQQHGSKTSTNSAPWHFSDMPAQNSSRITHLTPGHSKTTTKTTVNTSEMTSSSKMSPATTKTIVTTETRVDANGKKTTVTTRKVVTGNDGAEDWFDSLGPVGGGRGRMVIKTEKVVRR